MDQITSRYSVLSPYYYLTNTTTILWLCIYAGVSARNYVKETSNAIENEEYRVVDEEEAIAFGIQAASA